MKTLKALSLLICASVLSVWAQNTLMPAPKFVGLDTNGYPLAGGLVYTCAAGSTCPGTALASYSNATGTANTNPVVLDASGSAYIFLGPLPYRIVVKTSAGVTISDTDNVISAAGSVGSLTAALAASTGATLVGYKAPYTGSVARTVNDRANDFPPAIIDFAGKGDCTTDNAAAFATGLGALHNLGGGTLLLPAGCFVTSAFPVMDGWANIAIKGVSPTPGGNIATVRQTIVKYTGAGPVMLSAVSSYGIEFSGIYLEPTNVLFTGAGTMLINGNLSGFLNVINNSFEPVAGGARPALAINLSDAIVAHVEGNVLNVSDVDVLGGTGSYQNHFSNAVRIVGNYFGFFHNAIQDPGQGWDISGNTVEMFGFADSRFIFCNPQVGTTPIFGAGVSVRGNWIADASTTTVEAIDVYGYGWDISGNYIQGNAVEIGIVILPFSIGVHISGNHIGGFLSNVTVPASAQDVVILGNDFTAAVGSLIPMVSYTGGIGPGSGILQDWGSVVGATRMFGAYTFASAIANPSFSGAALWGNPAGNPGSLQVQGTAGQQVVFGTDGSGYTWGIAKNLAGVITPLFTLRDNGLLTLTGTENATGGYQANGTPGGTQVVNVRNSTNAGACTITYSFGLFISTTCP